MSDTAVQPGFVNLTYTYITISNDSVRTVAECSNNHVLFISNC